MLNIAILASGSGSNAEVIAHHFSGHASINVALIASNKESAFVLERAKKLGIPSHVFSKESLNHPSELTNLLNSHSISHIVLAGFLLKIPSTLIDAFPDKIVNIHPALLPKYGGKGMYGSNVHKAVLEANEKETGITIHLVNENYDEGAILFQKSFKIEENETLESLENKIHKLEHEHFAAVIENWILNMNTDEV